MTKIETLTKWDRDYLADAPACSGFKALRIIDAQAAEIERLRAEAVTVHSANDDLVARHLETKAHLADATAEIERLRAGTHEALIFLGEIPETLCVGAAKDALRGLFEANRPAAPARYATAAQSTTELMARVHAAPARAEADKEAERRETGVHPDEFEAEDTEAVKARGFERIDRHTPVLDPVLDKMLLLQDKLRTSQADQAVLDALDGCRCWEGQYANHFEPSEGFIRAVLARQGLKA